MSKPFLFPQHAVFCGIDVSARTLAVAVLPQDRNDDKAEQREFANSGAGHKQLIAWLLKRGGHVLVSLEATGIYSLDLTLALEASAGIEVALLNPKSVKQFTQTLHRSKTDKADALALAQYSRRMPFVAWHRPDRAAFELRSIGRYLVSLTEEQTAMSNRLHAATRSITTPQCVREDLKRAIAAIAKRIQRLRRKAVEIVRLQPSLNERFELMIGVKGIAENSAVLILGELAMLPADMTAREWVAASGLDPAHRESGTSVRKPSRISRHGNRHLRGGLYMPAMVAARFDPHLKEFYRQLLLRHKTKLQATIAVARKLLHAIYGMFKTKTPYCGAKLFPNIAIPS